MKSIFIVTYSYIGSLYYYPVVTILTDYYIFETRHIADEFEFVSWRIFGQLGATCHRRLAQELSDRPSP